MPDFRRYFVSGGTYFFTVVTAWRAPVFTEERACRLLGKIMREEQEKASFETIAAVLLPDHLHTIWILPAEDDDYPTRWQAIKARFTSQSLRSGGRERRVPEGYRRQRRRGVWQPRFMEHTIRDEKDLHQHVDYVHFNPVKHGYVCYANQWPWSSFHRFVQNGDYPENWGSHGAPPDLAGIKADLLE